ncbi:hypothetical protein AB1Y20_001919 [Prymnesium parvum]|uniref:Uncharacterized protein n=1 Tax=Prymnesium parvum TaxID=97485 RepID=A0AB34J737_PRYPA
MASSFCGSWSHPLIAITLSRTLDEVVTQSANWERDPPAVFARRLSVGLVMLDAVSLVNSNCLAVDMWGVKGTNAVRGCFDAVAGAQFGALPPPFAEHRWFEHVEHVKAQAPPASNASS